MILAIIKMVTCKVKRISCLCILLLFLVIFPLLFSWPLATTSRKKIKNQSGTYIRNRIGNCLWDPHLKCIHLHLPAAMLLYTPPSPAILWLYGYLPRIGLVVPPVLFVYIIILLCELRTIDKKIHRSNLFRYVDGWTVPLFPRLSIPTLFDRLSKDIK